MGKQRLPDGWEYNAHGEACETAEPLHIVWFASVSNELASDHEDSDLAKCVPTDVALAVLRGSGKDAVYEAAKELVGATCFGLQHAPLIDKLRDMIASLEES